MNTILQIILLIILFSNAVFLMLEKNILAFKIFKLSWIIALIDILIILFFFELRHSIILYIIFISIIVIFSLGLKGLVNNYNSNTLENNDSRKRFANFFVYFLLFFSIMLTIGVMKNLLFDSPLE
ncbi:FlaA1/EpsC-like NDP-sugar epimerase [Chryseobacterium lathyri]|nr:FlaA1/EpsC-like NDP-sugar epimerase [Chryseobacterium lathyri]